MFDTPYPLRASRRSSQSPVLFPSFYESLGSSSFPTSSGAMGPLQFLPFLTSPRVRAPLPLTSALLTRACVPPLLPGAQGHESKSFHLRSPRISLALEMALLSSHALKAAPPFPYWLQLPGLMTWAMSLLFLPPLL